MDICRETVPMETVSQEVEEGAVAAAEVGVEAGAVAAIEEVVAGIEEVVHVGRFMTLRRTD